MPICLYKTLSLYHPHPCPELSHSCLSPLFIALGFQLVAKNICDQSPQVL